MVNFEPLHVDKLEFSFNQSEKEISVSFPIVSKNAHLISKQITNRTFEIAVEVNEERKFAFKIDKLITDIGMNNKNTYYQLLSGNMERFGIVPDYDGSSFKSKFNNFAFNLKTANGDILEIINSSKWQNSSNSEVRASDTTWSEATGNYEKYDPSIISEAKRILEEQNFMNYAVEVISTQVVAQKPKITLAMLIGISSCLNEVLHSLAVSSPGKGKSMISEHVYEVFPKHRRFEFNTESSVAGLINTTKFKEGPEIFKGKLLYIGDLGNKKEQEKPKVQELLSMFKVLMSRGQYTKIITDLQSDEGLPQILQLNKCGAIMVECTSKNVEAQFEDRSIRWSPDDNKSIRDAIRRFQANELQKIKSEAEFNRKRPIVACGIDQIFHRVETLSKSKDFKILNPFGELMFKIFTIGKGVGYRSEKHLLTIPKLVTLCNLFQRTMYLNKEINTLVTVVTPEDFLYTLKNLGKSIVYMLSSIPENILSYIDTIEEKYVKTQEWPFTFSEYKIGFESKFENDEKNGAFRDFIRNCKPITAKDMAELMNVESDTARGYLNKLVEDELLYLKQKNGMANLYYPVCDYSTVKENIGAVFLKPEEISALEDEVNLVYQNFLKKLKTEGYHKAIKHPKYDNN